MSEPSSRPPAFLCRISRQLGIACFVLSLNGCQVVKKAEQCGALAGILQKARPELAPKLPDNPTAQALRYKASLFSDLAEQMHKTVVDNHQASKARDGLVQQFEQLSDQLELAAKAVEFDELARKDQAEFEAAEKLRKEEEQLRAAQAQAAEQGDAVDAHAIKAAQAAALEPETSPSGQRADAAQEDEDKDADEVEELLPAAEGEKPPQPAGAPQGAAEKAKNQRNSAKNSKKSKKKAGPLSPQERQKNAERDYKRARSRIASRKKALDAALKAVEEACR